MKLELVARIVTPELAELRALGWTKNHKRLDVFCVGKWRPMSYFLGVKGLERAKVDAYRTVRINAGVKPDVEIVINWPDPTGLQSTCSAT